MLRFRSASSTIHLLPIITPHHLLNLKKTLKVVSSSSFSKTNTGIFTQSKVLLSSSSQSSEMMMKREEASSPDHQNQDGNFASSVVSHEEITHNDININKSKKDNRHNVFKRPKRFNSEQLPKDDGVSLFFASGYQVPSAVAEVIKAHPQHQQYQENNNNNNNNNTDETDCDGNNEKKTTSPPPPSSRVYFTETQLKLLGIELKPGETPLIVNCPPGTTRKPVLTLFNALQTTVPEFFPQNLRSQRDRSEAHQKSRDRGVERRDAMMKKKMNERIEKEKQEQQQNTTNNEDDLVPHGFPHYFGGFIHHTNNNNNNIVNNDDMNDNDDTKQQQQPIKHIPRHLWPTLTSIAAQHGFTSQYWYTRRGMENALLRPKIDTSLNYPRKALPVVLRLTMFKNRGGLVVKNEAEEGEGVGVGASKKKMKNAVDTSLNNTNIFYIYQSFWNADQLESIFAPPMEDGQSSFSSSTLAQELLLEDAERQNQHDLLIEKIERELANNKDNNDNLSPNKEDFTSDLPTEADFPLFGELIKTISSFDNDNDNVSCDDSELEARLGKIDKNDKHHHQFEFTAPQEEEIDQDGSILPTVEEELHAEMSACDDSEFVN